ncbi:MAG: hypothetical protein WC984_09785 [Bacteroidales bacterium]
MEKKSTNIKERILEISDYYKVGKERFFIELGVTYGNFKGKSKNTAVNSDVLAEILTKYKDISPEWLILGSGKMIKIIGQGIGVHEKQVQPNNKDDIYDKYHTLLEENKNICKRNIELYEDIIQLQKKIIELQDKNSIPLKNKPATTSDVCQV